jgi:hypothetical protein
MGRAKEIIVKVIPAKIANEFVKQHHYSGKVVPYSTLHFGCFLDGKLHGVMQYGHSMVKKNTYNLVEPSGWNNYVELNRMAFDDYLPKNSESRCLSISIKLIKKNAPHVKWILSYSDATQCGDGCNYRASGFYLTGIKVNKTMLKFPNGEVIADIVFRNDYKDPQVKKICSSYGIDMASNIWNQIKKISRPIDGYQLRYIYLIEKTCKITVPILSFSKIDELGAGMYKGKKVSLSERKQNAAVAHLGERLASSQEGAFDATVPLQLTEIKQ